MESFSKNRNGFGKAVSRILSAPLRAERIICLSSQYPEPGRFRDTRSGQLQGPLFGLAPDGVCRASLLALRAVVSYTTFSPLPEFLRTTAVYSLWHFPSERLAASPPACIFACVGHRPPLQSYAASRPVEFGLSSPGLRQKRFSAFPKPSLLYQGNQEEQRWKIPSSKLQHPEKFQPSNTNTARRLIIEASLELGIWNLELSQRPLNPYPLNNKECARN
jgi:hypothetical protein